MSHEIRTPLNGVLGMAQALAATDLTEMQRQRLSVIQTSGSVLLELLNDILDLAKIEAGKLEVEQTTFSLASVAKDVHSVFCAVAEAKGLELSLQIAPGARGLYCGDPTRIRQLLTNFVSNAVKFTAVGGVEISIDDAGGEVWMQVCDTGIGIPADRIGRLFVKFEQVDASTTRRFGGTGLGLSICRDLAQLMGGDLKVESALGKGSTFTVRLPLPHAIDCDGAVAEERLERAPAASSAVADLHVLAAEDNPTNQLVLKTLLAELGMAVTIVEDGAQAVLAWHSTNFDLILMDMQMPVMDGLTATQQIRAAEAELGRAAVPIIALTADVMAHHVKSYEAVGVTAVVVKPLQLGELIGTLSEVFEPTPAQDLSETTA